ncbi:Annexin A4 [Hypsibius exemplaris]|uniref:Annexin A4 n=1 Tax=Hypsibius exemplaris TaxID=2072580 RepID=A0A1W0XD91_HYPEX|nr:Annexin A4 [Hypsibius exemplaris]
MSYPNQNQPGPYYPGGAPYPGYPPQGNMTMPGTDPYAGGPPQHASFPYPPSGNQAYPPTTGYPPHTTPTSYPPPLAGYPSGYPVQASGAPGYPPQQLGGYAPAPAPAPGYPPQAGYPNQQPQQYQQQQEYAPHQPHSQAPYQQQAPKMASGMTIVAVAPSEPTVRPSSNFNPEAECKALHKAMKGLGTDEKAIIEILTRLGLSQRLQLLTIYKTMFGKDLISHLKSELSGHLEDTVVAMLQPPEIFDATSLHDAISGAGTNEDTLIEIIFSRSNAELNAIKGAYKFLYKRDLENDIASDTSGHFKRIMIAGLTGARQEGNQVDIAKAQADAKDLQAAGPKKWGTDESTFITIFSLRSLAHLKVVFDEFNRLTSTNIEKVIKEEMSGNFESSFLAIAKIVNNKNAYFAELLYKAMKGAGTKDKKLVRIVVSRCEKDLGSIKQEFVRMYGKTLESFIASDISGDFKKIILALVNYGSR